MIEDIEVRAPQLGRLRMGRKGDRGQPVKLTNWRATSHDAGWIDEIAALYGGTPERWDDAPEGEQYEVFTESLALDVLVPPDALGADYERWTRGGCVRRCTGVTCMSIQGDGDDAKLVDGPCWCKEKGFVPGDGDDVKKGACDLVVRLNVVLPNVSGLGVARLDSGSVFAYKELSGQVQMLRRLSGSMLDVPAQLCIEQRKIKRPGQPTRDFIVPVLRVRRTLNELVAASRSAGALETGEPQRELESSRPSTIGDFPPHVQQVVYACGEHGVSKAESEALVAHFTGGTATSRKDLNLGQAGAMIAVLVDGSWRALVEAEGQPDAAAKPTKAAEAKARAARIHDLQGRAQALAPAYQDAMKVWLRQTHHVAKGEKAMRDLTDAELDAIAAKLAGYEEQAEAAGVADDDVAEGEVVEGNEQPELAAS